MKRERYTSVAMTIVIMMAAAVGFLYSSRGAVAGEKFKYNAQTAAPEGARISILIRYKHQKGRFWVFRRPQQKN